MIGGAGGGADLIGAEGAARARETMNGEGALPIRDGAFNK